MKEQEIWKEIKGFPNYMISNYGNIMSFNKKSFKKKIYDKKGYARVSLYKDAKGKNYLVHRLVAEAFIPNPKNKPYINHKDEIPSNNYYKNLEWVTMKENNNYGNHNEKMKRTKQILYGKIVGQYTKEGKLIKKFPSINEAYRQTKIRHIHECCQKKYGFKTAKGYVWKYELEV